MIKILSRYKEDLIKQWVKKLQLLVGMVLGYTADVVSMFSGKNLPVSAIRVKKFTSSTEFKSAKNSMKDFEAPFQLIEGIARTLYSEFIAPDPKLEIFFTE